MIRRRFSPMHTLISLAVAAIFSITSARRSTRPPAAIHLYMAPRAMAFQKIRTRFRRRSICANSEVVVRCGSRRYLSERPNCAEEQYYITARSGSHASWILRIMGTTRSNQSW